MADIKERIIIESVDNTTRGMRSAQNKLNAFDRTLKRVQTTMLGFVGINIATHMIQSLTHMSDSAVELDAKLKLMTTSTEDYNYAQQELVKISLESGSSLEANTILFTRMNKSIKAMGGNTQTTLDTTRALSQGLRISGASAQESASVIRQYSQAMASGVLRGEEFNAVSENGARIIQALSDSLNVSIGDLRSMSKEGELTAQVVTEALLKQSKVIAEENAKLPLTIGRAIENVRTNWTLLLQDMADGNASIAGQINLLAENFGLVASSLGTVVKVATAYVGIQVAKHFITQAKAIRDSIIQDREKALALKQEREATLLVIQADLERQAQLTKIALVKKQHHVAATQQHITELKNTVDRIRLTETEVNLKIASVQRQIAWEQKINNSQRVSILNQQKIIALRHRATLSSEALRTATLSLAGAEQTLTRALVSQTGAYNANFIAQRKSQQNQLAGVTKLGSKMKGFLKQLGSIDVLMSGFFGYEIGTWLYDNFDFARKGGVLLNWVIQLMINHFQFLKEAVEAVFSSDSIGDAWTRYMGRIEQLNAVTADMYENTTMKDNETANALHLNNNKRVANAVETAAKLKSIEDELQENILSKIDQKVILEKANFASRLLNEAEYNAAVATLENEAEELKVNAILESSNRQLGVIQEFYDQQVVLKSASVVTLNDLSDQLGQGEFARFEESLRKHYEYNEKITESTRNRNAEVESLTQEHAQSLREISQKTLDALISDAERLANKQRAEFNEGKAALKDYADFAKQINGDQRASYQKLADAQTAQRKIEKKLREASQAELEGDHEKAKRLRKEAQTEAKELTTSYKDIAESAKDGSRTQVVANNTVKIALDLVKESAEGVKKSTDALGKDAQTDLEVRKTQIENYQKIIDQLDQQINKTRKVTVDIDTDKLYSEIETIDAKIKALSQDVIVNVKTVKSGGGGDVQVKQEGGIIRRAIGGFIPRANKVPGTGSGDKVKALLEPGEFIMRRSAVQKFGESAMYAMNSGEAPVRRQSGGIIPGIQRFATGGAVNGIDELIERAGDKYTQLLDDYIRKAQSPTRGINGYFKALANSGVVSIIKNVIPTLSGLKGKDPGKVQNILNLNEEMISSAISSSTLDRGAGQWKKSLKNSSNRARLMALRDAWIQRLNIGGMVQKFNEGGSVFGSGLGDTVKALLTPGEYVMKKGAVQQFGTDFMNNINQGIAPERFAMGGGVGGVAEGGETINVNFNVNGSEATGTFSKNNATMEFIDQLKISEASS